MRGIADGVRARAAGRRRASIVTRIAALGSTAAAVVIGMGLVGRAPAATGSTAEAGSAAAAVPTHSASNPTGKSSAVSTRSRSVLRAPVSPPTSTTQPAHARSGGS
jgi:hypothetical protein